MIYGFVAGGDFQKGYRRADAANVGFCRSHDLSTASTAQTIEDQVIYAALRGIKLLLLYNMGSPDMALGNLVSQMARVGPNGTLWNSGQPGAGLGALAPTHIEVGNEWSYSYKGDQVTPAIGIATSVQRFYNAVGTGTSHGMKFICEGEDAGSGSDQFMNKLLETVPTIRTMLDGWTVHGYGPLANEAGHTGSPGTQWGNIDRLNTRLNSKGFTSDKIWITENGISTDNGVALTNNYGWNVSKTYSQAAIDLLAHVRRIGNNLSYSSRIYCYMDYKAADQAAPGANNDRESYFGIYKLDETAKGTLPAAATTLAGEFPVPSGTTTTPTPGGAVAGGNAPSDSGPSEAITFVSQAGTSILPAADPWVVQGAGSGLPGDFVVIGLVQAAQAPTVVSAPAGFTSDGTATEGTDGRLRVYYGYYSTVGAGPYSFDMSGSASGIAVCAYYRGVRSSAPLDATSVYSATTSSTAWATSALIPANSGAMIVAIAACSPGAVGRTTTVTAPATKRGGAENGAASLYVLGDRLLTSVASTAIAGTITPAESMAMGVLALRAAPVVAPPTTSETPTPGGAVASGTAPLARAVAPSGTTTAQGIGTAVPTYPSPTTYPSATTYPSPFAGLKTRTGVTAGGAISGGFTPPTGPPSSQSPTPGGAIADGVQMSTAAVNPTTAISPTTAIYPGSAGAVSGVSARSAVPAGAATGGANVLGDIQAAIPGGATAAGPAPVARATAAAGGAVAAGTSQTASATPAPGGAIARGHGAWLPDDPVSSGDVVLPDAVPKAAVAVPPGGATAAGTFAAELISTTPIPGPAVAVGIAPTVRTAVTAGGEIADGFSTPVGPTIRTAVAQGGAVAAGNAPGQGEPTPQGGAVAAGASPTARAEVLAGAAEAGGYPFIVPPPPPIAIPGGATADGSAPLASTTLTPGGATAAGTAPAPQTTETTTPGGAEAGATTPSASVAPGAGAASSDGNAPGSSAGLTIEGAVAGGFDQQASEQSAVPTPGGADAAGTGPYAWTTVALGGAIAATNQITGATVLITPGGSLAGGRFPSAPVTISRHFDDDDGPVLAGAFDAGRQGGQT